MRVILDKYFNQTVTTTHRMITVKKHSHLQVYRDVSESPGLVYHVSYVDSDFMEEAIIDTHSKGKV